MGQWNEASKYAMIHQKTDHYANVAVIGTSLSKSKRKRSDGTYRYVHLLMVINTSDVRIGI